MKTETEPFLHKQKGSFKKTMVAEKLLLNQEILGGGKETSLKTRSTQFLTLTVKDYISGLMSRKTTNFTRGTFFMFDGHYYVNVLEW
jgi:hypothetical protein